MGGDKELIDVECASLNTKVLHHPHGPNLKLSWFEEPPFDFPTSSQEVPHM